MNRFSSFQTGQSKYVNISHISGITAESFSEHEILVLNDLLLSPGLHTIAVKSLPLGRTILDLFVTLLNQYHAVYWLSHHKSTVPIQDYDLYKQLEEQDCLIKQWSVETYEAYLYEEFYGDLLIIECTQQLMKEQWYTNFEQAIFQTGLCERIGCSSSLLVSNLLSLASNKRPYLCGLHHYYCYGNFVCIRNYMLISMNIQELFKQTDLRGSHKSLMNGCI